MSIINDALKKAEIQLKKNTAPPAPDPAKRSGYRYFFLYLPILAAGLWLSNSIFNFLGHKTQISSQKTKGQTLQTALKDDPSATQTASPAAITVLPVKTTPEDKTPGGSFILSGVFSSGDDRYALVNNKIVKENDYVDGAQVSLITANTVELDNAGQTVTLSTQR